jgi:hypothetical protein
VVGPELDGDGLGEAELGDGLGEAELGDGLGEAFLVGDGLAEAVFFGDGVVEALRVGANVAGGELGATTGTKPTGVGWEAGEEGAREEERGGATVSAFAEPLDAVGTWALPTGDCPLWEEV